MIYLSALLFSLALADGLRAEPYACGPFLLQPSSEQMTVVIDHDKPVIAKLRYGRADGDFTEAIEHASPARHHIFVLEGLEAGVEYRYEIRSGKEHNSEVRTFRTLPKAPDNYRLIALGDVRTQPQIWHRVSEAIYQREKEALFIIGTGDYPADGQQYQQWIDQFFAPGRNLLGHLPIWPAIGNHEKTRQAGDHPQDEKSHYFSLFELPGNERWYRVDYRYTTLLIIDSNSQMGPESEQYQWLLNELRSLRNRFTIVAFHHDPVSGGPHNKLQADGTPKEWPIDQGRRFLLPLFEMYGVDLVLNGHDHLYERSNKNGVYYVVTGGGGAPLYKINTVENPYQQVTVAAYHYTTLDVSSESIKVTAIDIDGKIIDEFDIAR
jgi:3',5'-cyclic AMP phosphodiesterase CpdA